MAFKTQPWIYTFNSHKNKPVRTYRTLTRWMKQRTIRRDPHRRGHFTFRATNATNGRLGRARDAQQRWRRAYMKHYM